LATRSRKMRSPEDVAVTQAVRVSSYATADAKGIDAWDFCLVARALGDAAAQSKDFAR